MIKHKTFAQKRTIRTGCTLGLAAVVLCSSLTAEVEDELDELIVVSTRTPLGIDRVSPSVSYVSTEDLATWQNQRLVDVLIQQPGMALWSTGGLGNTSSLSVRGTESNHTAMFIEGRRLSPGFGNEYDLSFLTPANASSVQIQRGPSSVQYGSSNIGGVIDTRLRSGLGVNSPESNVYAEYGSNAFQHAGIETRVGNESTGFSLSTSSLSTDNERPNDAFEQSNLTSRFDWMINERLSFELLALGFANEKEVPGDTITPTPFNRQETTNWLISPGVRFKTDQVSAHIFYSRSERNSDTFEVNPAYGPFPLFPYLGDFPISNQIEVINDEFNLQVDYSLPGDSLLTFGAVFRNDQVDNSNIYTYNPLDPPTPYEESFQQLGSFAQILWMLDENTELHAGIRSDHYSDFDNETTGNLMLIHHFRGSGTSIFAKAATSYAPPSAVDVAYDSDISTPLNAESSTSYEIGAKQAFLNDRMNGSMVIFRNEIDNLLSYEPSTFDTFNIEQATTEGIEASISYQATDEWKWVMGYTYLRAVADRLNDPRTGGFIPDPAKDVPLARRPRHLVQLSTHFKFTEDFGAGLQLIGQLHRQDIDPSAYLQGEAEDFVVLRMVADWQVTKDWSIYGRIENLLDESYASAAGFPAIGRTAYVGVKYSF